MSEAFKFEVGDILRVAIYPDVFLQVLRHLPETDSYRLKWLSRPNHYDEDFIRAYIEDICVVDYSYETMKKFDKDLKELL